MSSDVRARCLLVTRVVVKILPWQPRHVVQMQDKFSSRRLEQLLITSCLRQSWTFYRQWLPSSSVSWYAGVLQILWSSFNVPGLVYTWIILNEIFEHRSAGIIIDKHTGSAPNFSPIYAGQFNLLFLVKLLENSLRIRDIPWRRSRW